MNSFKIPNNVMREMTQIFQIERNNSIIGNAHGFFCGHEHPSTIQLVENTDIANGDWLINSITGQRYFALDAHPIVIGNEIVVWMIKYETAQAHQHSASSDKHTTININSVSGTSAIGSQEQVIFNIGSSLNDIENLLKNLPSSDQPAAEELLEELRRTESAAHPVLLSSLIFRHLKTEKIASLSSAYKS